MEIRDRIGVDVGQRSKIEDGIEKAAQHGIRYLDLKIDIAPNAIETLTDERADDIKQRAAKHGIRTGIHTTSAVNVAETAPRVRDAIDAYLLGHLEACKRIGGEWMVVHAGYHFTKDYQLRRDTALARLDRLSEHAERVGIDLLLENMNKEPDDAEVHYLSYNLEETQWYFDKLKSKRLRWAFTANHAHIVSDGVPAFIDGMDVSRCDEVRIADCWRNGKEEHLKPGQGDLDFADLFRRLERAGFAGHYMAAWGSMDDMIEGREYLAKLAADL